MSISLRIKDNIEYLRFLTQIDSFDNSLINRAFTAIAQEIMELLKQFHPFSQENNKISTQVISTFFLFNCGCNCSTYL